MASCTYLRDFESVSIGLGLPKDSQVLGNSFPTRLLVHLSYIHASPSSLGSRFCQTMSGPPLSTQLLDRFQTAGLSPQEQISRLT